MDLISLLQNNSKINSAQTILVNQDIQNHINILDSIIGHNILSADEIAEFISYNCGFPIINLDRINFSKLPPTLVDNIFLKNINILALARRNDRLVIATSNPLEQEILSKIQQRLKLILDIVVVNHEKLKIILNHEDNINSNNNSINKEAESRQSSYNSKLNDENINNLASKQLSKLAPKISYEDNSISKNNIVSNTLKRNESDVDDTPAVKFLQKVLMEAVRMGASDVHFEPFEYDYFIRFRIDGVLHEVSQPPVEIKDKLSTRIKVLSKLDISEKRLPQDGRMKVTLDNLLGPNAASISSISSISTNLNSNSDKTNDKKNLDLRVSTLPTIFGEKIVIRILQGRSDNLSIDDLGYEEYQKKILLEAISRPHGMILVTGPTGSGKTVSLYTFLSLLNNGKTNISTAEDPVEIQVKGINQVNINEKAGLSFATALRSFLRQDPDVIMVGEIRDMETADIAIKAAQTGHMVFSTLHTNDAPSTLVRMTNMGIAGFNIVSSVHLITAQRLPRKLCLECKEPLKLAREVLEQAGCSAEMLATEFNTYRSVGCQGCNFTGYKGRIGIYQIMPISEAMQKIIIANGGANEIAKQARLEGVLSLRESGLQKVLQGITSLEEILAVTNA
jgi:type IV pilus assembly protein PilB